VIFAETGQLPTGPTYDNCHQAGFLPQFGTVRHADELLGSFKRRAVIGTNKVDLIDRAAIRIKNAGSVMHGSSCKTALRADSRTNGVARRRPFRLHVLILAVITS
jgi:hypothetical protein